MLIWVVLVYSQWFKVHIYVVKYKGDNIKMQRDNKYKFRILSASVWKRNTHDVNDGLYEGFN